jgi:hypothetical protein
MTHRRHEHATRAEVVANQPTTPTKAAVASSDNKHNGMLVSVEDIRLCAYEKWEAAGQPTGDGIQFWLEAERELVEGKNENSVRQFGLYGHHEHERPEAETGGNESNAGVDSHYRDNNRMFQNHGERGHRHGSS